MDIPKFTATATVCVERAGKNFFRSANASSAVSQDAARQLARDLAKKRATAAANGEPAVSERGRYPYPERVLIEPVLQELSGSGGDSFGRVTRNSYRAAVLNVWRVMFVDVDTESDEINPATGEPLQKNTVSREAAIGALGGLIGARGDLAFRVYETRAGLRYLCTSKLFDPQSEESADIMRRLQADTRYATLCRVQKCYRARLTPKPWRCRLTVERTGFWKFLGAKTVSAPERFATCRYLRDVGPALSSSAEIQAVVALHDERTGAASGLPLA